MNKIESSESKNSVFSNDIINNLVNINNSENRNEDNITEKNVSTYLENNNENNLYRNIGSNETKKQNIEYHPNNRNNYTY